MNRLLRLLGKLTGQTVIDRSRSMIYAKAGKFVLKKNDAGFGGFERFELVSACDTGLLYGTVIKFGESDDAYVASAANRPAVSAKCPFKAATALLS